MKLSDFSAVSSLIAQLNYNVALLEKVDTGAFTVAINGGCHEQLKSAAQAGVQKELRNTIDVLRGKLETLGVTIDA